MDIYFYELGNPGNQLMRWENYTRELNEGDTVVFADGVDDKNEGWRIERIYRFRWKIVCACSGPHAYIYF